MAPEPGLYQHICPYCFSITFDTKRKVWCECGIDMMCQDGQNARRHHRRRGGTLSLMYSLRLELHEVADE